MQTTTETNTFSAKLERIANVLRIAGWSGVWVQLALAAVTALFLVLAISGRNFNQAIAPATQVAPGVGIGEGISQTTPGIGIGIFWAVAGILVLLFNVTLAFRQTRFAKRLRHPNPSVHPRKDQVMQALRLGIIVGLIGMLLTILGGGASLGVLLAKSIAQPQGVAIYDPNRIIRSLDVFVAMANMNGITAHFLATVVSLSLFNWLYRQ
ncbi:DUF3611 family protein [Pantanalinema rosaneae CENA516]|uniref:DUF3611 family protein n=1 Tax=Pantanalinema rosaneae TaxID=1620701 RepID=UPI003D6F32D3